MNNRNSKCECGSGLKSKRCCQSAALLADKRRAEQVAEAERRKIEFEKRLKALEEARERRKAGTETAEDKVLLGAGPRPRLNYGFLASMAALMSAGYDWRR